MFLVKFLLPEIHRTKNGRNSINNNNNNNVTKPCSNPPPKLSQLTTTSEPLIRTLSDKSLSFYEDSSSTNLVAHHLHMLTNGQKSALQNSWKHMKDNNGTKIMERIFEKLTSQDAQIKELFYKVVFLTMVSGHNSKITTCRDHANVLFKIFDDIISDIDRCDEILTSVREMGKKHAFLKKSGLKSELWEKFGEVAVEVIVSQPSVRSSAEASRAWTVLLACITDEMCHGYKKQCRSDQLVHANWHSIE